VSWNYDPYQLDESQLMQVRLEVGDTDKNAPLLQDEEIERAIAVESSIWGAAARCCEIISRSFLRKADVRIGRGGTSLTYSTAAKQYSDMATALRKRSIAMNAPWAGGTSKGDKSDLAGDTDRVQPIFTKMMEENPRVGAQGSDSVIDHAQDEDE
jgi:hypothetical protein